jgi:hypothetical protein
LTSVGAKINPVGSRRRPVGIQARAGRAHLLRWPLTTTRREIMNRPRKSTSESSTSAERNNTVRPLRQQELETVRGGDGVLNTKLPQ